MNASFDPDRLKRALEALPPRHRVAFAAACCERLLPNYAAFARIARWGDPRVLREALDFIWGEIGKPRSDRRNVRQMIARCEELVPDTESFSADYTSAAVDASTAILETLDALLDASPQRVVDVASVCRDTVDMFVHERDDLDFNTDPDFEAKIAGDPLMVTELARQAAVLRQLQEAAELDRSLLDRVREEAHNGGVSNIGVR
jgi:uncharacterized protein